MIDNWYVGVSIMLPTVDLLKINREVGDVKLIYYTDTNGPVLVKNVTRFYKMIDKSEMLFSC